MLIRDYVTMKEIQEKLKVSRSTVVRWLKQGLPHLRKGHTIRVEIDALDEWLSKDVKAYGKK